MSMASMVQTCAPPNVDQHMEGSSAAFIFPGQLAFDCSPLLINTTDQSANSFTWQPTKISCSSPPLEGPFTPITSSSHAELHGDPHDDDTDYSLMHAIASGITYSDLLSLNANSQLSADLDMDYMPQAEQVQLGNSLRTLSMCSGGYGGIEQALQPAAAAPAENSQMQKACNYRDDVKLSHLTRTLTFPLASRARPASSIGGARAPLLLGGSDAQKPNHTINRGRFLDNRNTCRQIISSSAATTTTSCSGGQPADGQSKAKGVKSESFEMTPSQNQQEHSLPISTTKGAKQSRKRSAIVGSSITSVKTQCIETPPDVVHVRARRGQATDSHSLAERVRREKISQRMKVLQEIVPGCHKVLGKAMMLDEIINYVKSLQRQIEFLSMKLAAANHSGIASMIIDKGNYRSSNVEIFGDLSTSQHQLMQLEPLISSLMQ
ncbi:hypothetical protein GOP47_0000498 [Adiantum capillus-veneris]|uniref:BHLH domain-containing protein n=1 Tax=Adiantum capillus-veneris TaxID=13818 RepID=A0A9D4VDF1_ADICA|nr:hypothetical protein GOP47_0000498 [Adiantum capillus-veneris]